MRLNTIKPAAGSKRQHLRVGRGASAGQGKTCGRGVKASRAELTLDDLMRVETGDVTVAALIAADLVPEYTERVKIILSGAVSKAFVINDKAISATKGAKSAVETAG